jgi:hypothetical protein
MLRALLYLRITSARNQFVAFIKRLKEPKYLLGAAAAIVYLYYAVFKTVNGHLDDIQSSPLGRHVGVIPVTFSRDQFVGVAACILFVLIFFKTAWLLISPPAHPGLKFSEAEIAFLFSAPLTRKRLIHFNLLNTQFKILFSSLLLTLLFGNAGAGFSANIFKALGWWILLSSFSLYTIGSGLFIARKLQRSVKPMLYRIFAGLLLLILMKHLVSAYLKLSSATPTFIDPISGALFQTNLLLKAANTQFILAPFKILVAPYFSAQWVTFSSAFALALGVLTVLYIWILTQEVSFEEGSLALAQKRTEVRAAIASGKAPINASVKEKAFKDPFRLLGQGSTEVAFLWKNLISIQSWFNLRVIMILLGPTVFIVLSEYHSVGTPQDVMRMITIISTSLASITLFVGPQLLRQDLRSDLIYMDMLKTYPMKGWQIVLGEIATPVVVMSAVLFMSLIMFVISMHTHWHSIYTASSPILAGILVIPPICTLELLIPNAAVLIFPGLALSANNRRGGIEVMGQRLIFVFGQMLAVLIALLPAGIFGFAVFISAQWWASLIFFDGAAKIIGVLFGAGSLLALMVGEIAFALWWLGRRFEKFDLSKELPQGNS